MNWVSYSVEDTSVGTNKVTKLSNNKLLFDYPCSTPKCTNYKVSLSPGIYKFDCYGAGQAKGSAGAFTSGILKLENSKTFYFYIGPAPLIQNKQYNEVFNSGLGQIEYSTSGGGSTDIRLENGAWYSFDSLKTRIMVAAGSGASECGIGGSGGDLIGFDGTGGRCGSGSFFTEYGRGALQNSSSGLFGIGYNFSYALNRNGGGNGYYAGGTGRDYGSGGGGGSSFISGHRGCDAIEESSTKDSITHSGSPNHYSNIIFYNTIMRNGNEKIMDPRRNIEEGNVGNGKLVLTKLNYKHSCKIMKDRSSYILK